MTWYILACVAFVGLYGYGVYAGFRDWGRDGWGNPLIVILAAFFSFLLAIWGISHLIK